ncbi:MAG: hypothetical protein OES57_01605 [Acidimicrobiia bacterium]|nr:hypothetical protein [Acidimicrobiia bacterium]
MLVTLGLFTWGHFNAHRPTGPGLIVIPILCAIAYPIIRRMAAAEREFDLAGVAWLALSLKFGATYFRLLGGVDSVSYDNEGARLADSFRQFDFTAATGRSIPGTGTVRYTTGLVHLATNSSYVATFVIYSFVAFCGLLLFYRAFAIGIPGGNRRRYALLVFFWPSLLFWPSSIGKESLMVFGLGLASLGAARILSRMPRGLALFLAGSMLVGLVRPHVALIVITAMLVGLVFRAPIGNSLSAGAAKVLCIAVLLVVGAVVAGATARFLDLEDLDGARVVNEALNQTEAQTAQGGGEFTPARVQSPVDYPWAAVTVLFRPFIVEVSSPLGALSALEGMALAVLGLWSLIRFLRHVGRIRQSAYLAYAFTFVLTFCYLFSAIANFGILTRQRSQVLPFVMVCLALPQYVAELRSDDDTRGVDADDRPTLRLAR